MNIHMRIEHSSLKRGETITVIWITNYMTLIGDLFPVQIVGSVVGFSGSAGRVGGILSNLIIGLVVLQGSYSPLLVVCGLLYPLGLAVILLTIRNARQIELAPSPCQASG